MEFYNEVGRAIERARRSGQHLRPVTLHVDLDQVNRFAIDTFGCQPRIEGVASYLANPPARLAANRIEAAARIVVAERHLTWCIGHDPAHRPPVYPGVRDRQRRGGRRQCFLHHVESDNSRRGLERKPMRGRQSEIYPHVNYTAPRRTCQMVLDLRIEQFAAAEVAQKVDDLFSTP